MLLLYGELLHQPFPVLVLHAARASTAATAQTTTSQHKDDRDGDQYWGPDIFWR